MVNGKSPERRWTLRSSSSCVLGRVKFGPNFLSQFFLPRPASDSEPMKEENKRAQLTCRPFFPLSAACVFLFLSSSCSLVLHFLQFLLHITRSNSCSEKKQKSPARSKKVSVHWPVTGKYVTCRPQLAPGIWRGRSDGPPGQAILFSVLLPHVKCLSSSDAGWSSAFF